jgi:hypothetical protein
VQPALSTALAAAYRSESIMQTRPGSNQPDPNTLMKYDHAANCLQVQTALQKASHPTM